MKRSSKVGWRGQRNARMSFRPRGRRGGAGRMVGSVCAGVLMHAAAMGQAPTPPRENGKPIYTLNTKQDGRSGQPMIDFGNSSVIVETHLSESGRPAIATPGMRTADHFLVTEVRLRADAGGQLIKRGDAPLLISRPQPDFKGSVVVEEGSFRIHDLDGPQWNEAKQFTVKSGATLIGHTRDAPDLSVKPGRHTHIQIEPRGTLALGTPRSYPHYLPSVFVVPGDLISEGTVRVRRKGISGNTLYVLRDYRAGVDSALHLSAVINPVSDNTGGSIADSVKVEGDLVGSATVSIRLVGEGAPLPYTGSPLKLIEVAGASDAKLTLVGDTSLGGFDYFLVQGNESFVDKDAVKNWYLVSLPKSGGASSILEEKNDAHVLELKPEIEEITEYLSAGTPISISQPSPPGNDIKPAPLNTTIEIRQFVSPSSIDKNTPPKHGVPPTPSPTPPPSPPVESPVSFSSSAPLPPRNPTTSPTSADSNSPSHSSTPQGKSQTVAAEEVTITTSGQNNESAASRTIVPTRTPLLPWETTPVKLKSEAVVAKTQSPSHVSHSQRPSSNAPNEALSIPVSTSSTVPAQPSSSVSPSGSDSLSVSRSPSVSASTSPGASVTTLQSQPVSPSPNTRVPPSPSLIPPADGEESHASNGDAASESQSAVTADDHLNDDSDPDPGSDPGAGSDPEAGPNSDPGANLEVKPEPKPLTVPVSDEQTAGTSPNEEPLEQNTDDEDDSQGATSTQQHESETETIQEEPSLIEHRLPELLHARTAIRPAIGSYLANAHAANTMFQLTHSDRGNSYVMNEGIADSPTAWIHYNGSKLHLNAAAGQLRTRGDKNVVIMGVDLVSHVNRLDEKVALGVMWGYGHFTGHTRARMAANTSIGRVDGHGVGIYGTYGQSRGSQNGLYADSWFLWNHFKNRVSGPNFGSDKYDSKGITAAVELGYDAPLGQVGHGQFVLQPHAQVIYQNVRSPSGHHAHDTQIALQNHARTQSLLGLRAALRIPTGVSSTLNPYIEANWVHASRGYAARVDDKTVHANSGRSVGQLKLGIDGALNPRLSLSAAFFHQKGSGGYHETGGNLAVQYRY